MWPWKGQQQQLLWQLWEMRGNTAVELQMAGSVARHSTTDTTDKTHIHMGGCTNTRDATQHAHSCGDKRSSTQPSPGQHHTNIIPPHPTPATLVQHHNVQLGDQAGLLCMLGLARPLSPALQPVARHTLLLQLHSSQQGGMCWCMEPNSGSWGRITNNMCGCTGACQKAHRPGHIESWYT